jgi:dTDP-4-amino-4,6-dideoxygalactose transaminase
MEPYRSLYPKGALLLPETEKLTRSVMSLPNGTSIKVEDINLISKLIRFIIENSGEINASHELRGFNENGK